MQFAHESSATVAAPVLGDEVLPAPERLEGGDEDESAPARPQHPQPLAQGREVVVQVLQDVESGEGVEGVIGVGQALRRGQGQAVEPALPAEGQRLRRDVGPEAFGFPGQRLQRVARAAAHVEHSRPALRALR